LYYCSAIEDSIDDTSNSTYQYDYYDYEYFDMYTENSSDSSNGDRRKREATSAPPADAPLWRSNSASSALGLTVVLDPGAYFYELHEHSLSKGDYIGFKVGNQNPQWMILNLSCHLDYIVTLSIIRIGRAFCDSNRSKLLDRLKCILPFCTWTGALKF
jgi:hypothetical protein